MDVPVEEVRVVVVGGLLVSEDEPAEDVAVVHLVGHDLKVLNTFKEMNIVRFWVREETQFFCYCLTTKNRGGGAKLPNLRKKHKKKNEKIWTTVTGSTTK